MFDSPHTVEALLFLKKRPWISIGWHRHLWEYPVLPASEVPNMVDNDGRFKWRHKNQHLLATVPYEEAYKEFKAEMSLCYNILGRYPDTAMTRGDRNTNYLERAYQDICAECGIHMDITDGQNKDFPNLKYRISIIQPNGSSKRNPNASKTEVYDLKYIKDYNPANNIMSLTWIDEEHILEESSCTIHRVKELQGAISPEVKKWIIDNKIELVSQRDVMYGTSEYQDHLKNINSPLWVGNFK